MFSLTAAFLVSALAVFVPTKTSAQAQLENYAIFSCGPDETACTFGCCPYKDANCCWGGLECCSHGKTCLGLGICMGIETGGKSKHELVWNKAVMVRDTVAACPTGTTDCGEEGCCFLPNAVCCSDGEHCCPNGFWCDIEYQRCLQHENFSLLTLKGNDEGLDISKASVKGKPYKTCPGGYQQCPSNTHCCLDDNDVWSCCPKPTSDTR